MALKRLHISCLTLLLSAFFLSGQEMPSLGTADEIKHGSFPNGLEYYLVGNSSEKGFADFALVAKSPYKSSDRALLDSLPHFGARKPYRFLADNGVSYSQSGYMEGGAEARIVRFDRVPVYNADVADSTLMLLVDMAASTSAPQAVVVSGDIDVAKFRERLDLLSMMVPRLDDATDTNGYEWEPRDSMRMIVTYNSTDNVAAVNAIYRARRLPRSLMNTLQPLVTQAYSSILGDIVAERTEDMFRERGIPLGEISLAYHGSAESSGDEYYSFSVFTSAGRLDDATAALASVLSSIDKNGVTPAELEDTKFRMKSELKRMEFGRKLSNAEYVQKCIASYLYGSNLASEASVNRYIMGRSLPADSPQEPRCGTCRACIDACPTSAIADGGPLDARRCLSYLTIEHRGPLPAGVENVVGNSIYGCDRCQTACPWNRLAPVATAPELQPNAALLAMTRAGWHNLSADDYRRLFKGSAVKRAKYEGLMRNIRAAEACGAGEKGQE